VIEVGKIGHQEKIILKWMNVTQTEVAENKIVSLWFVRHKKGHFDNTS
jgi:hypothetical protein